MKKILCVIPTFSTKRNNEINTFKIDGKPFSIIKYLELQKSKYIDNMKINIITDLIKFAQLCISYDINIPFLIPSKIKNSKKEILKYCLFWYNVNTSEKFDYIIFLPSNYLFLDITVIDKAIERIVESKKYNILQSYEKLNLNELNKYYMIEENNCIKMELNIKNDNKYCNVNDCLTIFKLGEDNSLLYNSNNIIPCEIKKYLEIKSSLDFIKKKYIIDIHNNKENNTIKIKVLGNNHLKSNKGYFGFDCKILDKYLKSNKWTDSTTFSCIRDKTNEKFDIVVWRKKLNNKCTAHGRHKDKSFKIEFGLNEILFLKYNDKKIYNKIKNYKDKKFFINNVYHLFENKKIILCGNSNNGYENNVSNKFIDSHDVVIRVNSYKIIPEVSGKKTTIHFMNSLNTNFHTKIDPIFPECNNCNFILLNDDEKYYNQLKKIKKINKPIIRYNTKLLDNILFDIFDSKVRMTGPIIIILLILIRMNCDCTINHIGFSDGHTLVNKKQEYYWGKRSIKNNKYINLHNSHNFDKQYKLLNILDYIL